MSHWTDVPWGKIGNLFSVVICMDQSMRIIYASDTVHRYLPEVKDNPALEDVFDILRPGRMQTYSDAIASEEALCLMTASNGRFAVRGQLLQTTCDDREVICLCGAPWLFWMSAHCPDVRLGLDDFAAQDVQLDQLFFMSTERQMVTDLENLNVELTQAKNQLQEAHDAQHRFFAQMSHEMRTPLNGVVSALSLLEGNLLDDKQHQLVELAKSSSRNLMDVINYVLDLSKLELAGEDDESIFDLPELIRSTVDILRAKATEKSLDLRLELGSELPQYITGNASRLRQALLNLIMNAIKFTDRGSITVSVLNVIADAPKYTLKFAVTDTGIGIADEIKADIFEPFWSLAPVGGSHPGTEAGTGLGLDIVRRNVEGAGGEIGVVSEPGAGSTFWFDWPASAESAIPAGGGQTMEPAAKLDSNIELSGRVLLVDDNQTNLLLGTMIIESMGLAVSTAESGEAAVSSALQEDFDLVLMDIHLPDFDGIEATRQIRESQNEHDLPIVALTALAYDKEKEACRAAGMNGYLTKPVVREVLASELGRWLPSKASDELTNAVDSANACNHEELAPCELVDETVLENLKRQIGQDNLKLVLARVRAEAAQRWDELIIAEGIGDKANFQRQIHSLSSIFASVGLVFAGDAFASVEVKLRDGAEIDAGWADELEKIKVDSLQALNQQLVRL